MVYGVEAMTTPWEHPELEPDTSTEEELQEPRKYKVLLHNDDYTTMEFVVHVLKSVFSKQETEAIQIMLTVHRNGIGVCGIYTAEVAETKVALVHHMAKKEGYPLKCSMEEV
jgi:ATP-dependent Clp protease adaptor protein ClpS